MAVLRYIASILIFACGALLAQSELLELGTDQVPPGVSWQSLQSPHFRIIFPREIENEAEHIANLLERVYPADGKSLGVQPGPLPLILHNRNTVSNGFVTLAPRRSEWYNTPPQVGLTGPVGWYPLLAIHEFRHVVQFEAMKQGFNRLLYWSLGEYGWLAGAGISVPAWFFEGDAVVMETALTRGGRGRQPEFLMPIRTMLLSGRHYSYYKMNLGSYKNWIANPYEYGFVLNTWLRRQQGAGLWPAVLKSTAKLSFLPYRFSWALKRQTGMGLMKSHAAMLDDLEAWYRANQPQPGEGAGESEAGRRESGRHERVGSGSETAGGWSETAGSDPGRHEKEESGSETARGWSETAGSDPGRHERVGGESDPAVRRWDRGNAGFWTVYQAPQFASDGSVIALKLGLADQSTFIRIHPDGREENLLFPNPVDGSPHSLHGAVLLWSEQTRDPRWGNQDFRTLKRCDIASGTRQTLVARSRLFAPALSPDGRSIAAILVEKDNRCRLLLLNGENGNEIRRFENPDNDFLMTPAWSPDGREIICSRLTAAGRALTAITLEDGGMRDIISPGAWTITTPVWSGNFIFFSSNDGDTEQIFAVQPRSGHLFRVTTRPFGAFYPAPSADGRWLLFSDYDLEGYHIAEMALDSSRWRAIDQLPEMDNPWFSPVVAQEAGAALLDDLPAVNYPVASFGFRNDLIRIHSWQITADEAARTWGGRLYSQNLLGSLQTSAGYDYDRDEKAGAASASLTWARFYPLLDAGVIYGHRASSYRNAAGTLQRYTWREQSARAGLRLPLNFSRGGFTTSLSLRGAARLTWISDISDDDAYDRWDNQNGWWKSLGYALEYHRYRKAAADILPVRGQSLSAGFDHTPWKSRYQGRRYHLSASLYLPGLARRHGLALRADYEAQQPAPYRYSSLIRFPRGYGYRYQDKIGRLAIDYTLPLAYPDQHLWALLYVQRLKSLFFHDYGWSSLRDRTTFYRASGIELTADVNFFSLPVVFDLGLRLAWRWHEKEWRREIILGLPF